MAPASEDLDRRDQLLAAAERLVLEQNGLAITLNEVADELGVSRSLIYVYFDSIPKIIDALFEQHIRAAESFVSSAQYRDQPFDARVLALFGFYLEHLIERGPLMLLVLRERNQDSPLGAANQRRFRSLLRRISSDIGAQLQLSPRETFVLLELIASIPESLARMVRSGTLGVDPAQATTERLVGAAIDVMKVRGGS